MEATKNQKSVPDSYEKVLFWPYATMLRKMIYSGKIFSFCFMDFILTTDWNWALKIKMKSWFFTIISARQREYYAKYLKHDIKPYWLHLKIKMKQKSILVERTEMHFFISVMNAISFFEWDQSCTCYIPLVEPR